MEGVMLTACDPADRDTLQHFIITFTEQSVHCKQLLENYTLLLPSSSVPYRSPNSTKLSQSHLYSHPSNIPTFATDTTTPLGPGSSLNPGSYPGTGINTGSYPGSGINTGGGPGLSTTPTAPSISMNNNYPSQLNQYQQQNLNYYNQTNQIQNQGKVAQFREASLSGKGSPSDLYVVRTSTAFLDPSQPL